MTRNGSLRTLGPLVLAATALLGSSVATADKAEIFPLSKVKRGQKGYGLSTFEGTTPERWEFEVVGVMKNFRPKMSIILVKSDDPKMQLPGFWRGMSGSPLFIDDKLACAFSYGWSFNKKPIGGCTPIEFMIEEGLNAPVRARIAKPKKGAKKGKTAYIVPSAAPRVRVERAGSHRTRWRGGGQQRESAQAVAHARPATAGTDSEQQARSVGPERDGYPPQFRSRSAGSRDLPTPKQKSSCHRIQSSQCRRAALEARPRVPRNSLSAVPSPCNSPAAMRASPPRAPCRISTEIACSRSVTRSSSRASSTHRSPPPKYTP